MIRAPDRGDGGFRHADELAADDARVDGAGAAVLADAAGVGGSCRHDERTRSQYRECRAEQGLSAYDGSRSHNCPSFRCG